MVQMKPLPLLFRKHVSDFVCLTGIRLKSFPAVPRSLSNVILNYTSAPRI